MRHWEYPTWILIGTVALITGLVTLTIWQETAHPCIKSHRSYCPPTYVKSGSVIVPIGGGECDVCDERQP